MYRKHCLTLVALFVAAGCATTTPGARPHDMSAAQHEQEAQAHARTAETHATEYDPEARVSQKRCAGGDRIGVEYPCWTSELNPTAKHRRAAEEHRRHAADHRAASAALRHAEARACVGINPDDRDMSPFVHVEDIVSVEELVDHARGGYAKPHVRKVGARVTFHAVPGMTAERLQRMIDCHLARNASLGHVVPEMGNCPLVPKGVKAQVKATGNGFVVEIRSDDPETAREILSRAERLRPASVGSLGPPAR
jgi:hypothetical protein